MSNALAIAAVTATLRQLLLRVRNPRAGDPPVDPELVGAEVTAQPPHRARSDETAPQLNLFLYHVTYNAQLRNADLPQRARSGEVAPPLLALDLHYLLTAYGTSDDILAHRLLGWAMSALNDQAVLRPADIRQALPPNDLHLQPELVRVTPHTVTTEEMSRLWSMFQTPYRPSVAYQVSVVLLDSARPLRASLPVLERAIGAAPSLAPPTSALERVDLPNAQPSARLGDTIVLHGSRLAGAAPVVLLATPLLPSARDLPAVVDETGTRVTLQLPNDASAHADLPAGAYALSASGSGQATDATAPIALTLAPRLTSITPANVVNGKAKLDAQGRLLLSVAFSPMVWPEQAVSLLLGAHPATAPSRSTKVDTLSFTFTSPPLGRQFLRLRVDGVDSLVVDYGATPPAFDAAQSVEIIP